MTDTFLRAEHIVKRYAAHTALNDVSIEVPRGKVFGLLGPNGAGKTTLIRIINRITAPDSGEVSFDGHPFEADDVMRIGYLPEERGLYKKMKVGEQAIYLAQLKGLSHAEAKKRLTYWFNKFGIMPWWDKKLEELSKGMQQKVQFIITILHEPPLLIFDEPFSGFDPVNAEMLKREILNLRDKGHTVIFSTHNMASVEEVCDEIALINHSQVVLSGHVAEVKDRFRTGLYEAMTEARRQGKIRFIGITNHRLSVAREALESGLYDTLQFPFCYLSGEPELELVRLASAKNVGFLAMKALSGGLITNARAAYAFLADYP